MKKEINDLLKREHAVYNINDISRLVRNTMTIMGTKQDRLELEFIAVNDNARIFQGIYEIKSREFSGILEECIEITKKHMEMCLTDIQRDIKNGYNPTSGKVRDI
jgi:hypothetical protein